MKKLNDAKKTLLENLMSRFGAHITRKQLVSYVKETTGQAFEGNRIPKKSDFPRWIMNTKGAAMGRGVYNLEFFTKAAPVVSEESSEETTETVSVTK
jgi:hypothetical protein